MTLTRLDCGGPGEPESLAIFSDTHAFDGLTAPLGSSCYLIAHDAEYLLWDTGVALAEKDDAGRPYVRRSLVEQLAKLNVRPAQITYVGISHIHPDHLGQAAGFATATLVLGRADWELLVDPAADNQVERDLLAPWVGGEAKKLQVGQDKDVFGDGTVVMLSTPGHTPGHHSLLVRLRATGDVILSGDLAVFREGFERGEVPVFNTSRAETLASIDRIKRLAANLRARVVIQHDPRDVSLLPAFPAAAR